MRSYKRLGSIVSDARCAGLIDWSAITDRTRFLRGHQWLADAADAVRDAAEDFQLDKWENQENRLEVWIEKDALIGVIADVCGEFDVNYFSCRGYTSQSELWRAGRRLAHYARSGQTPIVIHLGDHDPSGMDMTRDIGERVSMFAEQHVEIVRIALNMDQVEEYEPPPNPAKLTDSRAQGYVDQYGYDSWELDALEPTMMAGLIADTITGYREHDKWDAKVDEEKEQRRQLKAASRDWDGVMEFIGEAEIEEDEDGE